MNKNLLALTLALTIPFNLLVGCTSEEAKKKGKKNTDFGSYTYEEVSPAELTKFYTEMSSIIPLYNLEGEYTTSQAKEEEIQVEKEKGDCSNFDITFDSLYDTIINNSITGINSKYQVIKEETEIKTDEEKKLDNLVREALKKALADIKAENLYTPEDIHRLSTIKIALNNETDKSLTDNVYDKGPIIVLNIENFKKYLANIELTATDEDMLEILSNALKYCLKLNMIYDCDCKNKTEEQKIAKYIVPEAIVDSTVRSYSDNITSETAKIIINSDNYTHLRGSSLILLLAAFKENKNIDDFYRYAYANDLEGLYNFFGLKTPEEKDTFYKILDSITFMNSRTPEELELELADDSILTYRNAVGYAYKADILKTCVKDLISYISQNQNLTMSEALALYNFAKNITVTATTTNLDKEAAKHYDANFVNSISNIEQIYLEFLSTAYNIPLSQVKSLTKNSSKNYNEEMFYHYYDNVDSDKLLKIFPLLSYIRENYYAYNNDLQFYNEENGLGINR